MCLDVTQLAPGRSTATDAGLLKIAILAVGGQGGGVLTDWIISLAEANGYVAQSTLVPGVAQRTGATIYYVEMLPDPGVTPVFGLTPAPGDVDIVIASEIMGAGRAVTRGFVTDDRTHVVASSHRIFAMSEKTVPGDGILASDPVVSRARQAARAGKGRGLPGSRLRIGIPRSLAADGRFRPRPLHGPGETPRQRDVLRRRHQGGGPQDPRSPGRRRPQAHGGRGI